MCGEGIYADKSKGSPIALIDKIKEHYFLNNETCPDLKVWLNDNGVSEIENDQKKIDRVKNIENLAKDLKSSFPDMKGFSLKNMKYMVQFVKEYPAIVLSGIEQSGESTYYPRRGPEDSRLDVNKSLREQFNMLRVVDNDRYPAFFEIAGERYFLKVEKAGQNISENNI